MIVIMKSRSRPGELEAVISRIDASGLQAHVSSGQERTIIGVIGDVRKIDPNQLGIMPGVDRVVRILHPFKLASRDMHPTPTSIRVGQTVVGSSETLTVIAGPCAVESEQSLLATAAHVQKAGATMLRGGAFKPRTSPYAFQGLGEIGLQALAQARTATGLPIVTEAMSPSDVELVASYADVVQVGARNMQNFPLLQEVGRCGRPVLLKRGMMATIEEWLMAAEYILSAGNPDVILCERGIRTFEQATRNTLDLSAIPVIRSLCHLPVIVDPSHATGRRDLVGPMAMAAIAAGADGLMIEVHDDPEHASCDGAQSLDPGQFIELMEAVGRIAGAVGRTVTPMPDGLRRAER